MAIIARAIRTITDLFDPIQQGTAPAAPVTGMLWLDTALTPNQLKRWTGTAWVTVNDPAGILTRLNAAETKITDSAIVSTVRSSSEYLADLAGKNRTWLQSTAPVGAAVGDLWIDTANGNLLKRWNGSSWANVQDAAVSIAQQTADKISWIVASGSSASNMTLTSQLYSLVSQNVVINADNLTATARDTLKLEAVGAIQVGGTNLLRNTGYDFDIAGWGVWSIEGTATISRETYYLSPYGTFSLLLQGNSSINPAIVHQVLSNNPVSVGEVYTVSFWIQYISFGVSVFLSDGGSTTLGAAADLINKKAGSDSYYYYEAPITIASASSYVVFNINITSQTRLFHIKLEKGNVATEWSPHPDDPVKSVRTSYINIDNDSIDIASGGDINIASGGNVNVAAGGKLNLTGADGIYIGTNPLSVGGTNLILASNVLISSVNDYLADYNLDEIPETGKVYTLTAQMALGTSRTRIVIYGSAYNVYQTDLFWVAPGIYSGTFLWQAWDGVHGTANTIQVYMPQPGGSDETNIYWIKLERGSIRTDWSPSPEDPATGVRTSYITIENDSIDIASGGKLNLSAADSIKIGLIPMVVGGTNLVRNSGFLYNLDYWGLWSANGQSIAQYNLDYGPSVLVYNISASTVLVQSLQNFQPIAGETYTISLWAQYVSSVSVSMSDGGSNSVTNTITLTPVAYGANDFRFFKGTMTIVGVYPATNLNIIIGGTTRIKNVKLEKGHVATDWSPHPDDPSSGVENSSMTLNSTGIALKTGGTFTVASGNFGIDASGNVTAKGAITANTGYIGGTSGWAITAGYLKSVAGSGYIGLRGNTTTATDIVIWAGHATVGSAPFRVQYNGKLYATDVDISGKITSTSGSIGGFTLGTSKLYSGKTTLTSTTAGVYVGTDGISLGSAGVAPQFKVTSAGALTASNATITGVITATSGAIGDFTLSSGHLVHSNSSTHEFVDLSKWGLAIGEDASAPNYYFPFSVSSVFDANYGHLRCSYGRLGALDFDPSWVIVKTANTVYSGTRQNKIIMDAANAKVTAYGGFFSTTPGYTGENALKELRLVKNDNNGNIDHATLPSAARGKLQIPRKDTKGQEIQGVYELDEDTCDLGMMVNILVKAIQELDARIDKLEEAYGKAV